MPTVRINGVELYYKESGGGRETIVFSHGLLMDHSMFEAQRAAFAGRYRVIAYDHRRQGQAQGSGNGQNPDMENLTTDAALLIQALNAAPCHFAGLAMGGFVGMRLAAHFPALLRTLTLMNTGAQAEPRSGSLRYRFLAQLARVAGLRPFAGIAMKDLFGNTTRHSPAQRTMLEEWKAKLLRLPPNAFETLLGMVARREVAPDELRTIACPTLVIAGEDDTVQPAPNSERLAAFIPRARLVRIPGCGHSSSLEAPEAVIKAMQALMGGSFATETRKRA